jgi:hypothetical protein
MFIQGIPAMVLLEGENFTVLRPRTGVDMLGQIS